MKELQLLAEGKTVAVPMQIFYSTDLPIGMVRHCQYASEIIKETVTKLDEAMVKWK